MKDMTDKFCATMDTKEETPILVNMPNNILKFRQFSNVLYDMDTNDEKIFVLINKAYTFVNTIEENLKCLSRKFSLI